MGGNFFLGGGEGGGGGGGKCMDVVVQHGGLMIKLCQGQGKFYQCIFQESKNCKS